MPTIARFVGHEVLDSRGNPTVYAICELLSGAVGDASVPSGASKGSSEAFELRDGEPNRYGGLGCRLAAENVSQKISDALAGAQIDQSGLDQRLIELDGTRSKSRLGANAILAASLAFARAAAREAGIPLYRYFSELLGRPPTYIPRPTINLFSGGKHAGGQVPVQDVLLVTISASSVDEALAMTSDVYRAAVKLVREKYGERALVADEGGLAPGFRDATAMLDDAVGAILAAHLRPGRDVALCIDMASTHFHHEGSYLWENRLIDPLELIDLEVDWLDRYPIVSIEDGLSDEDWAYWPQLKKRVAGRALALGDDLLATNPERIERAVTLDAADALLLKPNQIGTISEAMHAYQLARSAGWMVTMSGRSGETEDCWLADLAVGWSGDQLKVGSLTRSERLAKWNRLLLIERETRLPMVDWPRQAANPARMQTT
ncbi:MAG: phosphopyruvate hydratase [Fimbriimonadales bacterium]